MSKRKAIIVTKIILIISTTICILYHFGHVLWPCVGVPLKSYQMAHHENIVNNFYQQRKNWVTSNLGSILFKGDNQSKAICRNQSERVFNVLIWRYWKRLRRRHTAAFRKYKNNPLHGCSVSNCNISGNIRFSSADAVVVHLQEGLVPRVTNRNPLQLWIFWTDESPKHAFSLSKSTPSYLELSNIFNWSMTYRSDSDVPIPYGRTIALPYPRLNNVTTESLKQLVPYWTDKRTDVLATILASKCYPLRMYSLLTLKKYMNIDIYGGCATDGYRKRKCPGHFRSDCKVLSKYLFYIVIENSSCRQYITEKSFHHAYGKGAIPVFMGPSVADCTTQLPPHSFLHVASFDSPKHLAAEIIRISKNVTQLLSYHMWRNHFEVVNEHGYFKTRSSHMCRVCEALNYNERTIKVYGLDDIRLYLDPELCC